MPPKKKIEDTQTTTPQELAAELNKFFGGAAVVMGSDPDLAVSRWPTGILPIDDLLDGGIPKGRFLEIYGPYSTLKSYVLYKALGSVQKAGGKVALIDTEHSYDPEWAASLGVDTDTLLVSRPDDAESGIGVAHALIAQGYDLIGFDSIAAAQPRQYKEAMPGEDNAPGALARVMSRGLARLNASNKKTSIIFINQTRNKIGVSFGSPTTTSGGVAMGYYASYRMSFVRIGKITEDVQRWNGEKMETAKRVIAHKIQASLEKSKLSAPHSDAVFLYDLTTAEVNDVSYLIGKGLAAGIITRSTAGHYDIPNVLPKAIHGQAKFEKFLHDNPDVIDYIKGEVL